MQPLGSPRHRVSRAGRGPVSSGGTGRTAVLNRASPPHTLLRSSPLPSPAPHLLSGARPPPPSRGCARASRHGSRHRGLPGPPAGSAAEMGKQDPSLALLWCPGIAAERAGRWGRILPAASAPCQPCLLPCHRLTAPGGPQSTAPHCQYCQAPTAAPSAPQRG